VGKRSISFSHGFSKAESVVSRGASAGYKVFDRGESSRSIAERVGVGRTQIQTTIKRKADVLSEFETQIENLLNLDIVVTCL